MLRERQDILKILTKYPAFANLINALVKTRNQADFIYCSPQQIESVQQLIRKTDYCPTSLYKQGGRNSTSGKILWLDRERIPLRQIFKRRL